MTAHPTRTSLPAAFAVVLLLANPVAAEPLAAPPPDTGVVVSGAQNAQPQTPYGPGFNGGVVLGQRGPKARCRTPGNCDPGINRPFRNQYYRHYFDVPTPSYDRPAVPHSTRRLVPAFR